MKKRVFRERYIESSISVSEDTIKELKKVGINVVKQEKTKANREQRRTAKKKASK